jgi:hypothetical protein
VAKACDLSSVVPILIGVVGSREDTAGDAPGIGESFAAILRELRERYPQTPVVVLTTLVSAPEAAAVRAAAALDIEVIACIQAPSEAVGPLTGVSSTRTVTGDPRELIAYASDILVIVSSGAASPDLLAFVDRRRTGEPPPVGFRKLLAPADVGPYIELQGDSVKRFFPPRFSQDLDAESDFADGLGRRNHFNVDLCGAPKPADARPLLQLRTRTAAVTRALQDKTHLVQRVLYALPFLAGTLQIFTFIPHAQDIKVVAIVAAFIIFFYVRNRDYQNRYQDYRAISEALRVQAVWSAIGIADSVEESYLPMQQTDLQWIRNVLRTVHFLDWKNIGGAAVYKVVFDWVSGQHDYFAKHSRIEARQRRMFVMLATAFGVFALLASLVSFGVQHIPHLSVPHPRLVIELGVFAGLCVAILTSYSRTRGHSENANRYQRMLFVFAKALALLEKAKDDDEQVHDIARKLGHEALAEHAEWLLSQRERPIAMVQTEAS